MKLPTMITRPFYRHLSQGKLGYSMLWLLGVPLPVLLIFYFLRGH